MKYLLYILFAIAACANAQPFTPSELAWVAHGSCVPPAPPLLTSAGDSSTVSGQTNFIVTVTAYSANNYYILIPGGFANPASYGVKISTNGTPINTLVYTFTNTPFSAAAPVTPSFFSIVSSNDCGASTPSIPQDVCSASFVVLPSPEPGLFYPVLVPGSVFTYVYHGITNNQTSYGPNDSQFAYCNNASGKFISIAGTFTYVHDPASPFQAMQLSFSVNGSGASTLISVTTSDHTNESFSVTLPLTDSSINTMKYTLFYKNDPEAFFPSLVFGKMDFILNSTNTIF